MLNKKIKMTAENVQEMKNMTIVILYTLPNVVTAELLHTAEEFDIPQGCQVGVELSHINDEGMTLKDLIKQAEKNLHIHMMWWAKFSVKNNKGEAVDSAKIVYNVDLEFSSLEEIKDGKQHIKSLDISLDLHKCYTPILNEIIEKIKEKIVSYSGTDLATVYDYIMNYTNTQKKILMSGMTDANPKYVN